MDDHERGANHKKMVRGPLVSILIALLLVTAAVSALLVYSEKRAMEESLIVSARSISSMVFLSWRWNAGYGGVYVERRGQISPSDALSGVSNRMPYDKRGPRTMMRELSELAAIDGSLSFGIIGIDVPEDLDSFEKNALASITKGKKEIYQIEHGETLWVFRYVTPLYHDQRTIHPRGIAVQEGRVFGGISVTLDADDAMRKFRSHCIIIGGAAAGIFTVIMIFISAMFGKIGRKVIRAHEHIRTYGFNDPLTGALNMKSASDRLCEETSKAKRMRHPLSIILVNMDHLKRINDRYGYQSGSRILRSFVSLVRTDLRPYDVVGRLCGEGFILILPGITNSEAIVIAERLRGKTCLECAMLSGIPGVIEVTASFGVSSFDEQSDTAEAIIKRAERALTRAKNEGRNRVES